MFMKTIKGYILLTRPLNCVISFISIFIGGFVTGTVHPLDKLLLAALSGTLIAAAANAVNDVYDLAIDRVNKPERPLPSGMVSPALAHIYAIILFIVGIGLGSFIHWKGFTIAIMTSILLYLYSSHLKRTVLWGNLTVAFVSGLAFVYGGLAVGRTEQALIVGGFALFYHLAREIIKDAEDVEGDARDGAVTLPIRYGVRLALVLATIVMCLLIVLTILPYTWGIFSTAYLWVVVLGVDAFLAFVMISMWRDASPANLGRLALWMKFNMFVGLVAVYLGS